MILVYAYGCGKPKSSWQYARLESERCHKLWDVLVEIERAQERQLLGDASLDVPRLVEIAEGISKLSEQLLDIPNDKGVRQARRTLYAEQSQLLNAWRKEHKPLLRTYEDARLIAVKTARQNVTISVTREINFLESQLEMERKRGVTDCPMDEIHLCRERIVHLESQLKTLRARRMFWPNVNRVLQAYEAARQLCRKTGRRLRHYDVSRDDGVLAIQIQRTASGFGADPGELFDGTYNNLQIVAGSPDRRSSTLSMRVDADGNRIEIPVYVHRPLPTGSRIKAAQLTWWRDGARERHQLTLTVDTLQTPAIADTVPLSIASVQFHPDASASLPLMTVTSQSSTRTWRLPDELWRRTLVYRSQQRQLDEAIGAGKAMFETSAYADDFAQGGYLALMDRLQADWHSLPSDIRIWYRHARRLWTSSTGLRQHILGHRREVYRQIAREVVNRYRALELPDLDLAAIATVDRGNEENSARHWLALHRLRLEILHQARKAGIPILASGRVVNSTCDEKSKAWDKRKRAKRERSQT